LALYQTTASFPRDETYGLTAQIRRSASSIPSNIAEGCGRDGDAELACFCLIARGSASELEYQILLAHELKLIPSGRYEGTVSSNYRNQADADGVGSEADR
jgi:four helix bundle protein